MLSSLNNSISCAITYVSSYTYNLSLPLIIQYLLDSVIHCIIITLVKYFENILIGLNAKIITGNEC